MKLKYREHKILEQLLLEKTTKGNELSLLLGVSDRTIRNDIRNLNAFLKDKEIQISSSNLMGYFLEITEEKKVLLENLLHDEISVAMGETEYREKYILLKLLQNNAIDLNDIAEEIFISVGSLLLDLKRIEIKLAEIDPLFILEKKNTLISIEKCDERHIRIYLSLLLANQFSPLDIDVISMILKERVSFEEFKINIYKVINKHSVVLSGNDLLYFYIFVIVTILRSKEVRNLKFSTLKDNSSRTELIIEDVRELINKSTGIKINDEDKMLLSEVYNSFNSLKSEREVNYILMDHIEEILRELDDLYGTSVAGDAKFLLDITLHLDSYISKNLLNIQFSKTIIKEVKQIYPFAFNLSTCFVDFYEKRNGMELEFSEYEKALIAVHFQITLERRFLKNKVKALLVSSYGVGTTKLLEVQLVKEIDNLDVVANVSSVGYDIIDLEEIDLIITTVPLKNTRNIPTVKVDVPLDFSSIKAIKAMIHSKGYINNGIYPLIEKIPEDKDNIEKCFDYISDFISSYEGIELSIKEKFSEREGLVTTNLGKGIAMPHALFEDELKYNLYLFQHETGIQWGESKVHLVAAMLVNHKIQGYLNEYMKLIVDVYEHIDIKSLNCTTVLKLLENLPMSDL